NYRFAVMVLGPATMLLLLMPLFSVHRRIREEKRQRLVGIDEQIGERPVPVSRDEILELETLLAHRERLRDLRTWPLSTALLSRLFLYLIIPPLAWVGAALVETAVTQVIGG
ncbi:unnamed protein product, partial [marine sediment metagenome]